MTPFAALVLAVVRAAVDEPSVQRAAWELLLVIAGAIATTAAALVVLWKIVRPHVESYVRRTVAPIRVDLEQTRAGVEEVREEVKPARVLASDVAERTDRKLDHLAHVLRRTASRVEDVAGRVDLVSEQLDAHVAEADAAREKLRHHGIDLTPEGG